MSTPTIQQSKKIYTTPVVHVYGNIANLTQSKGSTNQMDGGAKAGFTMTKI